MLLIKGTYRVIYKVHGWWYTFVGGGERKDYLKRKEKEKKEKKKVISILRSYSLFFNKYNRISHIKLCCHQRKTIYLVTHFYGFCTI